MSHTKEPWITNWHRVESSNEHGWANDGWIIAGMEGPDSTDNAARIVACVNACAGMADPAAEIAALRSKHSLLEGEFQRQRECAAVIVSGLNAEIAALRAEVERLKPAAVPAGWQMVPVEPTGAMKIAGINAGFGPGGGAKYIYRAMLAAAPAPPQSADAGAKR